MGGGDTLEWATSSPPPAYNYAVIPKVTSAYPMWDREDRAEDLENLAQGRRVLERGHETPATTAVDADWDEILEMPSHSAVPPLLALALTGIFVFVLLKLWIVSAIFVGLCALCLIAWHGKEPQEA